MNLRPESPKLPAIGKPIVWKDPQTGNLMTGTCSGHTDTSGGVKPMFMPDEPYGYGSVSWPMEPGSWSMNEATVSEPTKIKTDYAPKSDAAYFATTKDKNGVVVADLYDENGNKVGRAKMIDANRYFEYEALDELRRLRKNHPDVRGAQVEYAIAAVSRKLGKE